MEPYRASISSFFGWAVENDIIPTNPATKIPKKKFRKTTDDELRAQPILLDDLRGLWNNHREYHIRDRCLWVMLYETAARANEILSLNVEDLDLANKEAVVQGKGDLPRYVAWASPTARLLPRIVEGRKKGPLFLTHRRPQSHKLPAEPDVCPETGRARLSYNSALGIFKNASGDKTLHKLRHSSLTHKAEKGEDTATLKAKSGHISLRSLERYINPSRTVVKEMTNRHDPNKR